MLLSIFCEMMALFLYICICGWSFTSVLSKSIPAACLIEFSGMVTNASITPNPPSSRVENVVAMEFLFSRNVDIVILRGSVTNEKTGYKVPFVDIVCEMFRTFCPVLKGERRKFEYSRYLGLVWPLNVPASVEVKFYDQDEKFIADGRIRNCSLSDY